MKGSIKLTLVGHCPWDRETCRFLNRRTAVVRLNRSLKNVIRTVTQSI